MRVYRITSLHKIHKGVLQKDANADVEALLNSALLMENSSVTVGDVMRDDLGRLPVHHIYETQ